MKPHSHRFHRILIVVALAIAAFWTNRGHADAPAGRYTMTTKTVYDTKTKLTWEREISVGAVAWTNAAMHCASLSLDGLGGWRLPTMKELQTIVDRKRINPAIDPTAFPNTLTTFFWTSSPSAAAPAAPEAWTVDFTNGSSSTEGLTLLHHVRCVRG